MEGFAEDVRGQGRVVIMASREDEVSYSGAFAPYLIDGLKGFADSNMDGIITAEEAFYYTEPRVTMQHPTVYYGYEGELPLIYLNSNSQNLYELGEEKKIIETETQEFGLQMIVPPENSIVCGYVIDNVTGEPIEGAYVSLEWSDAQWHFYLNETTSDSSGFYTMNVAAGEIYFDVMAGYGYRQKSTYRYDAEENKTLWANISLTEDTIQAEIAKPLKALHRNNNRILPFYRAEIVGSIDIKVYTHNYWYGSVHAEKVEFYIDGNLKATIVSEPYTWRWSKPTLGKHAIKIIAYDYEGNTATDEIDVWAFPSLNGNQNSQSTPQSNPSPNQQNSQPCSQQINQLLSKGQNNKQIAANFFLLFPFF